MAAISLSWSKEIIILFFITTVCLSYVEFSSAAPQVPLNIHSTTRGTFNSGNQGHSSSINQRYRIVNDVDYNSHESLLSPNTFNRYSNSKDDVLPQFGSNQENIASVRITRRKLGSTGKQGHSHSYTVLPASSETSDEIDQHVHSQENFGGLRTTFDSQVNGINREPQYHINTNFGGDDNGDDNVSFEDLIEDIREMSLGRRFHPLGVPTKSKQVNIPPLSSQAPSRIASSNNFIRPSHSALSSEIDSIETGVEVDEVVVLSPMVEVRNHKTSDEVLSLSDDFMNQYNFVDVQGTTNWGYKTEDQYQDHQLRSDGTFEGKFGWSVDGGTSVNIQYVADENGYRVVSSSGIYPQDTQEVQQAKDRHLQAIENTKIYHESLRNSMSGNSRVNSAVNTGVPLPSDSRSSITPQINTGVPTRPNNFFVIQDDDDIISSGFGNIQPNINTHSSNNQDGIASSGRATSTGIPLPTSFGRGSSNALEINRDTTQSNGNYLIINDDDHFIPNESTTTVPTSGTDFFSSQNGGVLSGSINTQGPLEATGLPLPLNPDIPSPPGTANANVPSSNNYFVVPDDDILSVNNPNGIPPRSNLGASVTSEMSTVTNFELNTGVHLPSNFSLNIGNSNLKDGNQPSQNFFVISDDDEVLLKENIGNVPSSGILRDSLNPITSILNDNVPLVSNIDLPTNLGDISNDAPNSPNFFVIPDGDSIPLNSNSTGILNNVGNANNKFGVPLPSFGMFNASTQVNEEAILVTTPSNGEAYSDFGLIEVIPQTPNPIVGVPLPTLKDENSPIPNESAVLRDRIGNEAILTEEQVQSVVVEPTKSSSVSDLDAKSILSSPDINTVNSQQDTFPKVVKPITNSITNVASNLSTPTGISLLEALSSSNSTRNDVPSYDRTTYIVIPVENDEFLSQIVSRENNTPGLSNSITPTANVDNMSDSKLEATSLDPCFNGKLHPSLLPLECFNGTSKINLTDNLTVESQTESGVHNNMNNENENNFGILLPILNEGGISRTESVDSLTNDHSTSIAETNNRENNLNVQEKFDPCMNSKVHPSLLPAFCKEERQLMKENTSSQTNEMAASVAQVKQTKDQFGVPLPHINTANDIPVANVDENFEGNSNHSNKEQRSRQGKSLRRSTDGQTKESQSSFIVVVDTGFLI